MSSIYHFPEITNPSEKNPCRTPFEQGQKVIEEALECFDEAKKGDRDAMLLECLDTIHACETMLRRNYTEEEVKGGIAKVFAKNWKRGYYGKGNQEKA